MLGLSLYKCQISLIAFSFIVQVCRGKCWMPTMGLHSIKSCKKSR
uniref:Uncharacterized protein n=1 Tax=Arundo donax TaxID=35708 RepID=A0A0A9BC42_ARUDO